MLNKPCEGLQWKWLLWGSVLNKHHIITTFHCQMPQADFSWHCPVPKSGEYDTEFFVKGKRVCREAWLLAHQLNKETFRRIHQKFKDGVLVSEHGNKGRKQVMAKTSDCIAWLQFFINCVGDHQPDKRTIHLPSCFSKSDIYKKMLEENTSLNQPTVSLSKFYNIWEKHFSHVHIPKVCPAQYVLAVTLK